MVQRIDYTNLFIQMLDSYFVRIFNARCLSEMEMNNSIQFIFNDGDDDDDKFHRKYIN